jgi:hypothetical protein
MSLEGIVTHCSLSDITVELTKPFKGIKSGAHTPAFAMFLTNRNLDMNGMLSAKGISTIQNCLISAYMETVFLYENKDELSRRLLNTATNLKELNSRLEEFKSQFLIEKKRMKSLLKNNEIMEKEFSSFLRLSREQIAAIENGIMEIKRSIFSGFQSYRVQHGNEDQNIGFVNSFYEPTGNASV